ncbi:hypothetical protein SAMN05216326_10149 [Nitrosomonas marina]|uniref:Uncharacterized protein n=1 Tax=Nitrosomonas marina TaxID=917 RepID=A0A1H9Y364_9PROT|nr:hypothetical protein SAMN05216326_10149 [Nitrosomonas marina]
MTHAKETLNCFVPEQQTGIAPHEPMDLSHLEIGATYNYNIFLVHFYPNKTDNFVITETSQLHCPDCHASLIQPARRTNNFVKLSRNLLIH